MSNTVQGGCRYYHPGVHCPLEGLWRLTQDCMGEEEEGAPACPPLSFLAPFHVFSMHTLSSLSLQTVHLPAGAGQTLTQLE